MPEFSEAKVNDTLGLYLKIIKQHDKLVKSLEKQVDWKLQTNLPSALNGPDPLISLQPQKGKNPMMQISPGLFMKPYLARDCVMTSRKHLPSSDSTPNLISNL